MEFTKRLKKAEYEKLSDEDKRAYVQWIKERYAVKANDSDKEGNADASNDDLMSSLNAQNEQLAKARSDLEKKLADTKGMLDSESNPNGEQGIDLNSSKDSENSIGAISFSMNSLGAISKEEEDQAEKVSNADTTDTVGSSESTSRDKGKQSSDETLSRDKGIEEASSEENSINGVVFHKKRDTSDTDTSFDWGITNKEEALGSGDKKAQAAEAMGQTTSKLKSVAKKLIKKYKKSKLWVKILTILIIIIIIFGIAASVKKSKNAAAEKNFASVLGTILNNNQGSFDYTFEIQASDTNGASKSDTPVISSKEKSSDAAVSGIKEGIDITASGDASSKFMHKKVHKSWDAVTSDWHTSSLSETSNWVHPNYILEVKGVCFDDSEKNMQAQAEILITTANKTGTFTHIFIKNGTTYINVQEMEDWLKTSQDSYLTGLVDDYLVTSLGTQYIQYKNSDLVFTNLWSQDSAKNTTGARGIYQLRGRESTARQLFWNYLEPIFRQASISSGDGNYTIDMTKKDSSSGKSLNNLFEEQIKYIITNGSSAFDTYYNNASDYYTDSAYSAEKANKDCVVQALSKSAEYLGSNKLNLKVTGTDFYDSEAGEYNATLAFKYSEDNVDYNIKCSLMRSMQSTVDGVTVPDNTAKGFEIDSLNGILDYMVDYFNPTKIIAHCTDTSNPTNVNWTQADNFIDAVNSSGLVSFHLNRRNLKSFVQEYGLLNADDDSLTTEDKNCIALYQKNKSMLSGLLNSENWLSDIQSTDNADDRVDTSSDGTDTNSDGSTAKDKGKSKSEKKHKYAYKGSISKKVTYMADKKKASNGKLLVLGIRIKNSTSSMKSVDLSQFIIVDSSGSKYYANSSDLLLGYDSNFDTDSLVTKMTVDGDSTSKLADLYFVVPDSNDKYTLCYDNDFNKDKIPD